MTTLSKQDVMPSETSVPYGYCHCGCGQVAPLVTQSIPSRGLKIGMPFRFIRNHHRKIRVPMDAEAFTVEGELCKKIPLTRGKFATVSESKYELVMPWKWTARKNSRGRGWYAGRTAIVDGKNKTVLMHRLIMGAADGVEVDHKNEDGLDNRDSNLRFCGEGQNQANVSLKSHNTSGYKGVSYHRRIKKWGASISAKRVQYHLGYFDVKEDAARAYDRKAIELFGEFANLNFPAERKAA